MTQIVGLVVVGTTGPEHESVHAHSHVHAVRLDALPHEHAHPFLTLHTTRLLGKLIVRIWERKENHRISILTIPLFLNM